LPKNTQTTGKARGGKRSTSWTPGHSGNPDGAPRKGLSWKDLIARVGEETCDLRGYRGVTWKEAVVRSAYKHSVRGNVIMFKELMQRGESLPTEINVNVRDVEKMRSERWKQVAPMLATALADPNEITGSPVSATESKDE